MIGQQHQLNGHEFEQILGDSEGWGSLACCSPWRHKESDSTEQINNNNNEEFRVMIVKMIQNLKNKMEKMKKSTSTFSKDLKERKNKQR